MSVRLGMVVALLACTASAQDVCEAAQPLDGQRLLRRLSLDVRGVLPTHAEQVTQGASREVPDSLVDSYLASEDFVSVMRRYHEQLLWPNLDGVELSSEFFNLIPQELAPGVVVYWSPVRSFMTRTITRPFVPCRAVPATFDANGPVTEPLIENGVTVAVQEGFVEVAPYWAPNTRVKVCAFDASTATTSNICPSGTLASRPYLKQFCDQFSGYSNAVGLSLANMPMSCDEGLAILSPTCGCGPNLRFCSTPDTIKQVRSAMLEQQLRVVDKVVRENRPYSNLLLTKDVEVNGALAHYLTYQARTSFDLFGELDPTAPVPTVPFATGWVDVPRTGRHSGVLTTAGFLLKFQSNRARANRFASAFECGVFVPSGPLPSANEPCSKREDLTKRCGCDACHTALEPMAAHWGRFAEYGHTPLDDRRYPKRFESVCTGVTSLDQLLRCYRFYQLEVVGDETPYRGLLKPYVFRPDGEVSNVEIGPTQLTNESLRSGRLSRCTVRRVFTHFMHRAPTAEEEQSRLPALVEAFDNDNRRLRGLVKSIVTHPSYRRLP